MPSSSSAMDGDQARSRLTLTWSRRRDRAWTRPAAPPDGIADPNLQQQLPRVHGYTKNEELSTRGEHDGIDPLANRGNEERHNDHDLASALSPIWHPDIPTGGPRPKRTIERFFIEATRNVHQASSRCPTQSRVLDEADFDSDDKMVGKPPHPLAQASVEAAAMHWLRTPHMTVRDALMLHSADVDAVNHRRAPRDEIPIRSLSYSTVHRACLTARSLQLRAGDDGERGPSLPPPASRAWRRLHGLRRPHTKRRV